MNVAQSAIISKWFKGRELAFALGFNLSVSRLGSTINGFLVPISYEAGGLGFALLVGFIICIFSLVSAICLILMDRHADKVDGVHGKMISDEDKFRP